MFRLIWPGALPCDSLQRLCYPSIDRVLQLVAREPDHKHDDLTKSGDEFSAIMRHIRIGTVWKCTNRNRLEVADQALCAQLRKEHLKNLRFLDVGGSDGVTTLDLVNHLEKDFGIEVEAFLADRYLVLLRLQRRGIVEYVATDGEPVLVRVGPLGLLRAVSKTERIFP